MEKEFLSCERTISLPVRLTRSDAYFPDRRKSVSTGGGEYGFSEKSSGLKKVMPSTPPKRISPSRRRRLELGLNWLQESPSSTLKLRDEAVYGLMRHSPLSVLTHTIP